MMWHLYPDSEEAQLIDDAIESLRNQKVWAAISNLALELSLPRARFYSVKKSH